MRLALCFFFIPHFFVSLLLGAESQKCVASCSTGVEMVPNQVMGKMVLDGGGHFILSGISGLQTLSLLLTSLIAHDRATEDTRTHTGKEHMSTNTRNTNALNVGAVHKPRQGCINSVPL